LMKPCHAKSKGKAKGLCYCVVLYFQGVTHLVVPKTSRSPDGSTSMGDPKSAPIAATSQVRRGRTIVQACCEPENYRHRSRWKLMFVAQNRNILFFILFY
jgi:hypothetical protein